MDRNADFIQAITGKTDNPLIVHEDTIAVVVSVHDQNKKKGKVIRKFNFTPMSIAEAEHQAQFGLDLTDAQGQNEYDHEDMQEEVLENIMKKSKEMADHHTVAGLKKKKKKKKKKAKDSAPEFHVPAGFSTPAEPIGSAGLVGSSATAGSSTLTGTSAPAAQARQAVEEHDPYDDLDRE